MASAVFASSMHYLVAFYDSSVRQSNFFFSSMVASPHAVLRQPTVSLFGNEYLSQIEVKGEGSGTYLKLVNDGK